jgi:hypothetical protein
MRRVVVFVALTSVCGALSHMMSEQFVRKSAELERKILEIAGHPQDPGGPEEDTASREEEETDMTKGLARSSAAGVGIAFEEGAEMRRTLVDETNATLDVRKAGPGTCLDLYARTGPTHHSQSLRHPRRPRGLELGVSAAKGRARSVDPISNEKIDKALLVAEYLGRVSTRLHRARRSEPPPVSVAKKNTLKVSNACPCAMCI